MTSPIEQHIETIAAFIAGQMDAGICPPSNSAEVDRLREAIEAIHKSATDRDLSVLALRAVGLVIDRMGSSIAAERTLRDFIQPGGES